MNEVVKVSQRAHGSIEKVFFRNELAVEMTRTATIKGYIKELLRALDKGDSHQCFEAFSEAIVAIMQSVLDVSKPKVPAKLREAIFDLQHLCCKALINKLDLSTWFF